MTPTLERLLVELGVRLSEVDGDIVAARLRERHRLRDLTVRELACLLDELERVRDELAEPGSSLGDEDERT